MHALSMTVKHRRAMKALTMNQPWGSLFLTPEKQWETRSRRILFRGWLAIHTSKVLPNRDWMMCQGTVFRRALQVSVGVVNPDQLPRGSVIGVVQIIGCVEAPQVLDKRVWRLPQGINEADFGNFASGRFAWQRATQTYRLPEPVPCKGWQGLWDLPPDVEAAVVRQLSTQTASRTWPPTDNLPCEPSRTYAVRSQAIFPEGYWSLPQQLSSSRYHFFSAPTRPSLCARWNQHAQGKYVRNIVPNVDCPECVRLLQATLEPRAPQS